MRFAARCGLAWLILVMAAAAKELPEAPSSTLRTGSASTSGEPVPAPMAVVAVTPVSAPKAEAKVIDSKFLSLAIISTGSTFADSYTTLFARENWLAGKQGVCNIETESPYLYGTHPTVGRTYAVAVVKSAGSAFASYYLRRHHSKLWSLPLLANAVMSLQGVGQNIANCN
jgi:hypothetical protein